MISVTQVVRRSVNPAQGRVGAPASVIVSRYLALVPVVSVTLLAKFGVPPFANRGLGIALGLLFLSSLLGMMTGRLSIAPGRLVNFSLMFGLLGVIQLMFPGTEISLSSLLLLLFLCVMFVLEDSGKGPAPIDGERVIVTLALFFALCGLYQFIGQKVLPLSLVKPVDTFVPSPLLVQGYNSFALETYKSERLRPNGIFFLEPSFFSQFLALAILLEIYSIRRSAWRIGILFLGLITSISGTGLIVLAVGSLGLASSARGRNVLILIAMLLMVFVMFHDEIGLHVIWERLMNFSRPGTSSHQRFISGYQLLSAQFTEHPGRILFGFGAGQLTQNLKIIWDSADTAPIKLVFEYGIVGFVGILFFMTHALRQRTRSWPLVAAMMTSFLVNGAAAPFFYGVVLTMSLWQRRLRIASASSEHTNPIRFPPNKGAAQANYC